MTSNSDNEFTVAAFIEAKLLTYTIYNSNYEESRRYIGLSHAAEPYQTIFKGLTEVRRVDRNTRLKCYKGYQMEKDLISRLKTIFPDELETGREISAFNGLVKGHPDFWYRGYPGDCKSVLMDAWIPEKILPAKVYWQMQAYMLYSHTRQSFVIYESRENGILKVFTVNANSKVMNQIELKYSELVKTMQLEGIWQG